MRPVLVLTAALLMGPGPAMAVDAPSFQLELPVQCTIGVDCYVQQLPDMAAGPATSDPFCGAATYDGHDGIDIRIRDLVAMQAGVPVVASLPGTVRGVRDGVEDRLVETEADRAAIADRECGNGVVLAHPDGVETQYCHMRRGSVAVTPGDRVETGQKLGEIGASGLAQFPHVHLSLRVGGAKIDPVSGRRVDTGCAGASALAGTLLSPAAAARLPSDLTAVLGLGLTDRPLDHAGLTTAGPPPTPSTGGSATVLWAWLINLRQGDQVRGRILAPDGSVFFEGEDRPVERAKANYSWFGGRKRPLQAGRWTVELSVLSDGRPVHEERREIDVR